MDIFDIFILVLRLVFVFLVFFVLWLVVNVINREFSSTNRRRVAQSEPVAPTLYPNEGYTSIGLDEAAGPSGRVVGRVVITNAGTATTVRSGQVFDLSPVTPIGRKATNALRLDDAAVSGEHALLAWRDGRWYVSDVASTNGTFVNGEQTTQPRLLNWGDLIGIGGVRMRLEP